MKLWIIIGLSGFLFGIGSSQVQMLWEVVDERGPEGTSVSGPIWVRMDQVGSVYATGVTVYRNRDFLLMKYASDGTWLWNNVWNGGFGLFNIPATDTLDSLVLDRQGNVLLGGRSSLVRQGGNDGYRVALKYAPDGSLLWERKRERDGGFKIAINAQNNVIGVSPYFLLQYAADGTLLWEQVAAQPWMGPTFLQLDPQGNILVGGGEYHIRVRKYSLEGTWLWDWFAPSSGWDRTSGLYVDSNSNAYVMAMYALNPDGSIGSYDLALWKLNPDGQVIWHARHNSPYDEWQYGWLDNQAFAVDEPGNAVYAVVNGGGYCIGCNPVDRLLLKFRASDGQLEWAVPVQMPDRVIQRVMAVRVDEQGRVYVLGNTVQWVDYDPDIGEIEKGHRFVLARFDSAGRQHGVYEHRVRFYPNNLQVRGQEMVVGGYKDGLHVVKMKAVALRSEGDLTGDECVADGDLARVLRRFGTNSSQGDVNGDGVVNEVDLRIVLENFGLGCRN